MSSAGPVSKDVMKLSRIFVQEPLQVLMNYQISEKDCHYVTSVMRLKVGSSFRVFNGHDGEFVCDLESIAKNKKSAVGMISKQIREQTTDCRLPIILYCASIKKPRMKLLLEKVKMRHHLNTNRFRLILEFISKLISTR